MKPDRKTTHRIGHAALLAVLAALVLTTVLVPTAPSSPRLAPDFTLTQTSGRDTLMQISRRDTLILSDFRSNPILLFFFDAGEMTSLNAMPYVREWTRRYSRDGLKVMGVHMPGSEPMGLFYNAVEATSRAKINFVVGMDFDRSVYKAYAIKSLPTYLLLRPGLEIVFETSAPKPYVETERAVQNLLAELKPGIINPFFVKPFRPEDDPSMKVLPVTPKIVLGYRSGAVAGCDSTTYDKFHNYTDSGEKQRGKVYLQGYWKVGPGFISHEARLASSGDHLRVIYSGKDVWILPFFVLDSPQRIYVKQDREYLHISRWGGDIFGDLVGQPFINMRYSIPMHVVSNPSYGTHELELSPAEGDVSFYYLFFEGGTAE